MVRMFGSIGGPELILILIVALIIFGPRKLPELGKSLGRGIAEFRKASQEFKTTLEREIESEKDGSGVQEVKQLAQEVKSVAREAEEPAPAPPPPTDASPAG
jgi:TatA/E family protein of Tat protein translocase